MTARTWEDHKTMNVPEVQGRVAFPGVPSKPRPSGYISHLLPPPSRRKQGAPPGRHSGPFPGGPKAAGLEGGPERERGPSWRAGVA